MYLQDVDDIFDIKWNKDYTYGDIFNKAEYEHSVYSFEKADVNTLKNLFDVYEEEAKKTLEEELVIPSYEFVLKCSHTFNLLDARGAISVSERTTYIGRVRALARVVARKYIEQRREMDHPLIKKEGYINE